MHHVAYRCKDAKATADFYKQALNMDVTACLSEDKVPSTGKDDPYMHVFLDAGNGNILAFFELPNQPKMTAVVDKATPDWVQHIAFQIATEEELADAKDHLEKNCKLDVVGPTDHGIFTSIYFFDPNGHRIELAHVTGTVDEFLLLRKSAPDMLVEWSKTKKAVTTSSWLHKKEFAKQAATPAAKTS